MCVILAVSRDADDVTVSEWEKATCSNSDGYGIAWLEDGMVKFLKASYKDSFAYKDWRPPKPYIMHFRLATVGGDNTKLCHPFIVSPKSKLTLTGRAHEVLFHNGHWNDWAEWLAITYSGLGKLPKGPFSDSRALASMVGHYGPEIIKLSGAVGWQKIALFDKEGDIHLYGGGWETNSEDKIIRSNSQHLWSTQFGYYHGSDNRYAYDRAANIAEHVAECLICGENFLTYREDDAICNSCDTWNNGTSSKPTTLVEKPKLSTKHCSSCGIIIELGQTFCVDCLADKIEFNCKECEGKLFMDVSIAVQHCDKCISKGTLAGVAKDRNMWYFIQHHLKEWRMEGSDTPLYAIPATFYIQKVADNKREFVVVLTDGKCDPKDNLYIEGTVNEDMKEIQSRVMDFLTGDEDIRAAMQVRT